MSGRLAFPVLAVAVFLSILDLFIVNVAFPDLEREFSSASLSGLSWVLSAYLIVFAALLVPAGRLGDQYGRRRVFTVASFAAMLLTNILFLTEIWGYDALGAGLGIAPSAVMAAVVAGSLGGRMIARHGPGLTGAAGTVLYASGGLWWLWQAGADASYVEGFLPGQIVGGAGVGLTMPAFTAAAAATLPPERLSTGLGVTTMFRQIGAALGVAALVAIVGVEGVRTLGDFQGGWVLVAALSLAGGVAFGAISRAGAAASRSPASVASEATA